MISLITDLTNDIMLDSKGNLRVEGGAEACRQIITNGLRLQQYEYGYDLTRGINWLGYLLADKANVGVWRAQVLDFITGLSFVKAVEDFRYRVEGNVFLFQMEIDTVYGQIEIKG